MLNLNDWLDEKEPSKIINAENIAFPKCKNFGIGYQGSKNRLAKEIISFLPSADYFVDLFAGGCAITHAALLSGKYKKVITNDIDEAPSVFYKALNGEYNKYIDWIGKDEFDKLKYSNAFIRYTWSFGNNGINYLYAKSNEAEMKERHLALVNNIEKYSSKEHGRIISLERIKRLREIANSKKDVKAELTISNLDYQSVEIPENAVVYCDIPYKDTRGYEYLGKTINNKNFFNHLDFYEYCYKLKEKGIQVFISEYDMPSTFKVVWQKNLFCSFNRVNKRQSKIEKLFTI